MLPERHYYYYYYCYYYYYYYYYSLTHPTTITPREEPALQEAGQGQGAVPERRTVAGCVVAERILQHPERSQDPPLQLAAATDTAASLLVVIASRGERHR